MTPLMQTILVALIVLGAAVYVGRKTWRAMRPKADAGCASDCGCSTASSESAGDWSKT